jgi:hypothetical protein
LGTEAVKGKPIIKVARMTVVGFIINSFFITLIIMKTLQTTLLERQDVGHHVG